MLARSVSVLELSVSLLSLTRWLLTLSLSLARASKACRSASVTLRAELCRTALGRAPKTVSEATELSFLRASWYSRVSRWNKSCTASDEAAEPLYPRFNIAALAMRQAMSWELRHVVQDFGQWETSASASRPHSILRPGVEGCGHCWYREWCRIFATHSTPCACFLVLQSLLRDNGGHTLACVAQQLLRLPRRLEEEGAKAELTRCSC